MEPAQLADTTGRDSTTETADRPPWKSFFKDLNTEKPDSMQDSTVENECAELMIPEVSWLNWGSAVKIKGNL